MAECFEEESDDIKGWISLGSEAEVEDERREDNRNKMKFVFKKQLKYFGGPLKLVDSQISDEKRNTVDCPPLEDKSFNILASQQNKFVQFVSQPRPIVCQTEVRERKNIGTQYISRELSEDEQSAILMSDGMIKFLETVIPRLFDVFEQQQLVDAFTDD